MCDTKKRGNTSQKGCFVVANVQVIRFSELEDVCYRLIQKIQNRQFSNSMILFVLLYNIKVTMTRQRSNNVYGCTLDWFPHAYVMNLCCPDVKSLVQFLVCSIAPQSFWLSLSRLASAHPLLSPPCPLPLAPSVLSSCLAFNNISNKEGEVKTDGALILPDSHTWNIRLIILSIILPRHLTGWVA